MVFMRHILSAFKEFHACEGGECDSSPPKGTPAASVRVVDATGTLSNQGLVQVRTDQGFGSVCGINAAAADTVCREMGYLHGVVRTVPCSEGGANLCGSRGTPVAMQDLKCVGNEASVAECEWKPPDDQCQNHLKDSIIACSNGLDETRSGAMRIMDSSDEPSADGSGRLEIFWKGKWGPVCNKGFSQGSAAVACREMGFSGMDPGGTASCGKYTKEDMCGKTSPHMELACSGTEDDVLKCPNATGNDVKCSPQESVVIRCRGDGDATGMNPKMPPPAVAASMPLLPFPSPADALRRSTRRHRRDSHHKFL